MTVLCGGKADLGEVGGEGDPVEGWGDGVWIRKTGCRGGGGRKGGGVEGVGEESVLDIGGDEFLVLLLVVEAEDDAAGGFGVGGGVGGGFEGARGGREKLARRDLAGMSPREL